MKSDLPGEGREHESLRQLTVIYAGSRRLGILNDEIDTIVNWRIPTPIPGAPKSVLGVVSIRGRMLTVLDAAGLLGEKAKSVKPAGIVALRGDEQLAVAIDSVAEVVQFPMDKLTNSSDGSPLILGVLADGDKLITILNAGELFAAAIRGRERRRRRF
jgi:purine-binding chemotaxis protein CheW